MSSLPATSLMTPDTVVNAYRSRSCAEDVIPALQNALESIDPWRPPPASLMQSLCAIAASAPDLIPGGIARALAGVFGRADLTGTHQPGLDEVFHVLPLLVPTPAAIELPDIVRNVIHAPGLHARWERRAIALLAEINLWKPEALTIDYILEIAGAAEPHLWHKTLIDVLEQVVLRDPASITVEQIHSLLALSGEPFRLRYLLNALTSHPETEPGVRKIVEGTLETLFPLRAAWNALAGNRALQVLCVQNIADGQGDEVVRVNALVHALLDAHPETHVTLVSDRCYLWDHPRLHCISFDERDDIITALNDPVDILIECFEDNVTFLNYDVAVHVALDQVRVRQQPQLDIALSKRDNLFTIDSVQPGGQEWARALEVDSPRVSSVYDPMFRLIAELGLPLPWIGGEPPLWNRTDVDAWSSIVEGNLEHRPVALLNPFGGSDELKGYSRRMIHQVGPVLTALAEEGYFVVVWPGEAPWASMSIAAEAISYATPDARRYCVVGPDPAQPVEGDQSLTVSGRFMRLTLSGIQRANLVVTIEGWMEHAAFALNVPFRILMAGGSQGRQWLPWGRSLDQRCWLFPGEYQPDNVPLLEQPRKQALLELLARMDSPAWSETLTLVARSEDFDLRTEAARAIGRCGLENGQCLLLQLLSDTSGVVRGAAADSLLTYFRPGAGKGNVPGRGVLEIHRLLAAPEPDLEAIVARAAHAIPALQATLYDDDPVKRRIAAALLEHIARETAGQSQTPEEAC